MAWRCTLRTVDPGGVVGLVGAILRGTPSLPGATCRGRYGLFDGDDKVAGETPQQRYQAAVTVCGRCHGRRITLTRPAGW
ncbi:MAG: hypothetical protein ACRDTD_08660 [Pseudonocardiaceae bacterium]